MDNSLRISNYSLSFFKDRTGISINVTLSDGSTGTLQRNVNKFNVMHGKKCLCRMGYTHPDFKLVRGLYDMRNEKVQQYREAIRYGKGKNFII